MNKKLRRKELRKNYELHFNREFHFRDSIQQLRIYAKELEDKIINLETCIEPLFKMKGDYIYEIKGK